MTLTYSTVKRQRDVIDALEIRLELERGYAANAVGVTDGARDDATATARVLEERILELWTELAQHAIDSANAELGPLERGPAPATIRAATT